MFNDNDNINTDVEVPIFKLISGVSKQFLFQSSQNLTKHKKKCNICARCSINVHISISLYLDVTNEYCNCVRQIVFCMLILPRFACTVILIN